MYIGEAEFVFASKRLMLAARSIAKTVKVGGHRLDPNCDFVFAQCDSHAHALGIPRRFKRTSKACKQDLSNAG